MMFCERQNLNSKTGSKTSTEVNNNNHKYDAVKKFNNKNTNNNNNVGDVPPSQLNTMPPPPHKLMNCKSVLPVVSSNNGNRREYWRSNYNANTKANGRSVSPLGYDSSDESCKSYGSKGNRSADGHGECFFLTYIVKFYRLKMLLFFKKKS